MPWRDSVAAIAVMFLGGQETGNAWADILFGDKPPSGRLPIMIPDTENDTISPSTNLTIVYTERLRTSYRNRDFIPAYPFGHGLTYTTFVYNSSSVAACQEGVCIDFFIYNVGAVAAKAVPQLYLQFPANVGHPVPFLKGFQKTSLIAPGSSTSVTFVLGERELSFFNSTSSTWMKAPNYTAHIGASSTDIKISVPVEVALKLDAPGFTYV